ncbi:hypothetical protein BX666DRAFT_2026755 [Dichotomocladium elegans]|nr:hypothetical protein BX666DRAFT_2026755 [Dichotomocladium elegans]
MSTATHADKPIEFFFIDMNDPGRYKKLKVAHACDFCRRRKSKCDLGTPGSGVCSNCQKAHISCVFESQPLKKRMGKASPQPSTATNAIDFSGPADFFKPGDYHLRRPYEGKEQQQQEQQDAKNYPMIAAANEWILRIYDMFPAIDVHNPFMNGLYAPLPILNSPLSLSALENLENSLYEEYFITVHPLYPVLDDFSGDIRAAVHAMPVHQRSSLLALVCNLIYPELVPLANLYAQTAESSLGAAAVDLTSAQTLLLLYHYHETLAHSTPNEISSQSSSRHGYLKRASDILSLLSQDDCNVLRVRWLFYLHICWGGYADTAPWKHWCLEQSRKSLAELRSTSLAGFCRLTMAAFQHAAWPGFQRESRKGTFGVHCALIHDMMTLPFEHVLAAERIEYHSRLLVGTVAQRAAIQSHNIILRALKMSLHTYITFYATSLFTGYPIAPEWICQRLWNIRDLFEQLGTHPTLCDNVQEVIYYLS